ncbi:MAG: hypothetical protein K2K96_10870 [Lachnospiraceae bacterium]|nr:hypothetical protein [Lachnospiraceae bacterium]
MHDVEIKVDTRFWVTTEAEKESEERSHIQMSYTTKNWGKYRNLPEEIQNQLDDILWDNYQLPGIMEMSIEEVLALDKSST